MIFTIPDTPYRIAKLDDLNWCIQERHVRGPESKNAGEEWWGNLSYHRTCAQACATLARDYAQSETLAGYGEELDRIATRLVRAVDAQEDDLQERLRHQ